jgi:hypothetical protein
VSDASHTSHASRALHADLTPHALHVSSTSTGFNFYKGLKLKSKTHFYGRAAAEEVLANSPSALLNGRVAAEKFCLFRTFFSSYARTSHPAAETTTRSRALVGGCAPWRRVRARNEPRTDATTVLYVVCGAWPARSGVGCVKLPSNAHFYDAADPALGFSDFSKRTFRQHQQLVIPYKS